MLQTLFINMLIQHSGRRNIKTYQYDYGKTKQDRRNVVSCLQQCVQKIIQCSYSFLDLLSSNWTKLNSAAKLESTR